MSGKQLPQLLSCNIYKKQAHKPHNTSLQASNPVSMNTSFFLQAEGHSADSTGDQSPIHKYASSNDESDTQSDSDLQSLRKDDSQSDHNSDDAHNSSSDEDHNSQLDNDISLYSDDSSIEWQSMSLKRKLPEEVQAMPEEPKAVLCFSSVSFTTM